MNTLLQRIAELGVLRLGLLTIAALISIFATPPGTGRNPYGWAALPTLVLPAAAPLVLFVILFDVLMSCVQLSAANEESCVHWKRVLTVDMAFIVLLIATWWPYFEVVFTVAN